ncbi:SUMF1/EgtB/PvdO family nonheme iron enzyme [Cystobacter fuscus]|uniref:protein kinase domain-containing protein n=1 Tax=Cystobacter fuscus TaxID=43 RepID=UPI002B283A8A|nr:SUMF1/EgtB/PvdO family nonheme iron enzyme [Cystobacter fuscus]
MLCQRCGSPVPDNSASCTTCGLKLAGASAGAAPRRRTATVEAPYKPGDTFARRYAIREVIGPGPVGHVFRAQDLEMDVEVALKVINPRLVQMQEERTQFSLALRAGKKLTHPHHMRVYEEGEDRNRPFFTTQLLEEGLTLRRKIEQRVSQGQRFSLKEVEALLVQLVEALDSAHRYGPHSDLKPENIFLLPDLLKVTDYGLALGIPRLPYIQAQKAWKVGCYLAPEYFEGGELDTRMDLYALGIIVGEMLTGQVPEEGEVSELLAYEADLPSGIEALYRRATNANPLARPKTAGEFLSDFTAALSSRPRPAAVRPATQGPGRAKARQQVPFSLTAELATAAPRPNSLPPPVPTSELPALGAPTVQVPTVGHGPPPDSDDDDTAVDEAPKPTLESPISERTTLELPQVAVTEEIVPPDATQKLDSEALAAIMDTASSSTPSPAPAPKARAPRAEPRPPAKAAAPSSRAATRTDPVIPAVRPSLLSRLWMPLLAAGGLGLGAMAGYGLLKWRQASQAPAAPVAGAPSVAAPREEAAGAEPLLPSSECPKGMRRVSGGTFKMGKETAEEGTAAEPLLMPRQVATFCIDEFEFPNRAGAVPRVDVTWEEARAECGKLGKRLCSEDEWEKACKGPGSLRFPYGATFDAKGCNTQGNAGEPAASGSFARCRSGYGVADMSGNVAEWTSSSVGGADRVQKGGAFDRQQPSVRCSARMSAEPDSGSASVGFRCCKGEP